MGKTVSILGLGWLGAPLAKSLINNGYNVKGSVTSFEKTEEFKSSRIETSIVNINANSVEVSDIDFFKTDVLYINIPPRRLANIETIYPAQIEQIIPFILSNNIKDVIFISSTSVYPELNEEVTERYNKNPQKGSGIACRNAEQLLLESAEFSTTVIRFGGLIGSNRNPHRFMRKGVQNGPSKKPINLIHQDDCIGIIEHIIKNKIRNEVINACCPIHPTREEFYQLAAKVANVDPPLFSDDETFTFKIVNSDKIKQLGYNFKFNSPTDYLKKL